MEREGHGTSEDRPCSQEKRGSDSAYKAPFPKRQCLTSGSEGSDVMTEENGYTNAQLEEDEDVDFSIEPDTLMYIGEEEDPPCSSSNLPRENGHSEVPIRAVERVIVEPHVRRCEVCEAPVKKVYRHMLATHLPWFFQPETACWTCRKPFGTASKLAHHQKLSEGCSSEGWPLDIWLAAMVRLLDVLAEMLKCRAEHLHIKSRCVTTPVSPLREVLLVLLEEAQGKSVTYIDLSPPNCPSSILTVTLMGSVLAQLPFEKQFTILKMSLIPNHRVPVNPIRMVDAHCHLKQLSQREPHWQSRGWRSVPPSVGPVDLVINNRVFPGDWHPPTKKDDLTVLHSYGAHPRLANQWIPWGWLQTLMRHPDCVAIGECGLDGCARR